METWAIVTLVLGSSAVSAALTFFITKMQVSHSDTRLEKQLQSARETDSRQRKREVRGEALLKLREELARMANKLDKLNAVASQKILTYKTAEIVEKEIQDALDDFNTYMIDGNFQQTLFMQYDKELVDKAEYIMKDYQKSFYSQIHSKQAGAEEVAEAWKVSERNKPRISEIQELINKKLEEL